MVPDKRFKRNQQHPQMGFVPRKRFRWYQMRISHGTRRTDGEQSDCERPKRRLPFPFSLGRCHGVTEGYDTARPGAGTEKRLWFAPQPFFRASEGTRTHTHEAPDPKSGLATNYNTPASKAKPPANALRLRSIGQIYAKS